MMRGDVPPASDYVLKIVGMFAAMVRPSHTHTKHCG